MWTAREDHAPANQRRLECGIVETASGKTSTSTAPGHLLRRSSEVECHVVSERSALLKEKEKEEEGGEQGCFRDRRLFVMGKKSQHASLLYCPCT
ncbi:hypothetical protein WMY93_004311 [Mugilogobius chulae]|uniref:Uncharacterized protein n=1 Tax=Mugilogobius chulae TaxID=88201 RepID=A0AAW0PN85_9GOBI